MASSMTARAATASAAEPMLAASASEGLPVSVPAWVSPVASTYPTDFSAFATNAWKARASRSAMFRSPERVEQTTDNSMRTGVKRRQVGALEGLVGR